MWGEYVLFTLVGERVSKELDKVKAKLRVEMEDRSGGRRSRVRLARRVSVMKREIRLLSDAREKAALKVQGRNSPKKMSEVHTNLKL